MSGGKISQSNTGSMSGGMQAAIGNNNNQEMSSQEGPLTHDQATVNIVKMLLQIQDIIQKSDMPESAKEKSKIYLESAKLEVQEDDKDKQTVLNQMGRAFKTIKEADNALEMGKRVWSLISPLSKQIMNLLG